MIRIVKNFYNRSAANHVLMGIMVIFVALAIGMGQRTYEAVVALPTATLQPEPKPAPPPSVQEDYFSSYGYTSSKFVRGAKDLQYAQTSPLGFNLVENWAPKASDPIYVMATPGSEASEIINIELNSEFADLDRDEKSIYAEIMKLPYAWIDMSGYDSRESMFKIDLDLPTISGHKIELSERNELKNQIYNILAKHIIAHQSKYEASKRSRIYGF